MQGWALREKAEAPGIAQAQGGGGSMDKGSGVLFLDTEVVKTVAGFG
jgi:hypothetical protein